ncbi:MAG: hypothetical protein CL811_01205 [Colwelliaceae bacterium]|nr:hypothetical protein [Colwelliaceae bacterium]|tara:strand:+ start:2015 stop:2317 length:303 start_codon:yes stop_codon:yes gene_type:complete
MTEEYTHFNDLGDVNPQFVPRVDPATDVRNHLQRERGQIRSDSVELSEDAQSYTDAHNPLSGIVMRINTGTYDFKGGRIHHDDDPNRDLPESHKPCDLYG